MAENINRPNSRQQAGQIDLIVLMVRGWQLFKKTWWLLILFLVAGIAVLFVKNKFFYTEEYEASASFAVTAGGSQYIAADNNQSIASITLQQLNATFPYILESGALQDIVAEDIGVDVIPGTISASVLGNTNLFRISVRSGNAQMAADILASVIENYPTVAKYIIGNTTMTMLDTTGVPTAPVNMVSIRRELVMAAGIAAMAYLGVLILLALVRNTILSEEDLRPYTNVRCLADIPKTYLKKRSGKNAQLLLVDQRSVAHVFIESINTLRIRTARHFKENMEKVMLVTSVSAGEGKTTIVSNLALSYAQKGYKVLVIDGDLRHPSICEAFGLEQQAGLRDVLNGTCSTDEVMVTYDKYSLDLLAGRHSVSSDNVTAMLGSAAMKVLIEDFRNKYDYIFIDTSPCGTLHDAATLVPVCDCCILVIRQDYNSRERVLAGMELLADTGISLLGYVINYEETSIGSYGYGRYGYGRYGYGWHGKYSKYVYGEKKDKESSEHLESE